LLSLPKNFKTLSLLDNSTKVGETLFSAKNIKPISKNDMQMQTLTFIKSWFSTSLYITNRINEKRPSRGDESDANSK